MSEPAFLSDRTTTRKTDTLWSIENKWLGALLNGGCSGCGGGPVVTTYYILTQLGEVINAQNADKLTQNH